MTTLDKFALAMIAVALGFVTLIAHAPFSIGLLAGAGILAGYGFYSKQNDLIAVAPFLPPFGLLAWAANYAIYRITPHTIDASLLNLDHGVAVAVWHWTAAHLLIFHSLEAVYYGLGIAAAVSICSSPRRSELLRACVIAACAAPLFYFLFPAVGPRWIGHEAARNCIPSLHFTWALLLLIYCSPKVRVPMLVFVLLTGWATMGLGEHYFIDLVAALPFTCVVRYAAETVTSSGYSRAIASARSVLKHVPLAT